MPVLISRHVTHEGPGYLAQFLARHGVPCRTVKIDAGEALPESIDHYSGLVFMGGPMSVNDDLPWIPQALHLIREAVEADVPVLGHCLGAQLLSKALGGVVGRNPVKEIGWLPVRRVPGAASPWLAEVEDEFEAFHWHGETFSLPVGAAHLLASDACVNQAFAVGKSLGLQFHVEMTAQLVRRWASLGGDAIARPSPTVQTAEQMTQDLEMRVDRLNRVADHLYRRWIEGLR